jgi:hypothetical protein
VTSSGQSPTPSTADHERPSVGRPRPRHSTSSYGYYNSLVVRRSVESGQYTSIRYTSRLVDAGAVASIGTVGDSYDNAQAETLIGLYKTEMVRREGPWRSVDDLELATLNWVHWFNEQRLHGALGHVPPVEYEQAFQRQKHPRTAAAAGRTSPLLNRGRFTRSRNRTKLRNKVSRLLVKYGYPPDLEAKAIELAPEQATLFADDGVR